MILKNSRLMNKAVEAAGILDALTSLATAARQYEWSRPAFVGKFRSYCVALVALFQLCNLIIKCI